MRSIYLLIPFAPLVGAIVVGLWGPVLGRRLSHWICIAGVAVSTVASAIVLRDVLVGELFNGDLYIWMTSGGIKFSIGFLMDASPTPHCPNSFEAIRRGRCARKSARWRGTPCWPRW